MPETPLEPGLHLHIPELRYGEVQVLQCRGALPGVMFEQQLGKLKPRESQLRTEFHPGADLHGFFIVLAGLFVTAE